MFLNKNEIRELTGYIRPSDQIKFLAKNKMPFTTDKNTRPLVLRGFIEQHLGFNAKAAPQKKSPTLNPLPKFIRSEK